MPLEVEPFELDADIGVAAPEREDSVGDGLFFGFSFISTSESFVEPVPSTLAAFFFVDVVELPLADVDFTIPGFTDDADNVPPVAFGGSEILFIFNLRCVVPGTGVPDADLAATFFLHLASPSFNFSRSGASRDNPC